MKATEQLSAMEMMVWIRLSADYPAPVGGHYFPPILDCAVFFGGDFWRCFVAVDLVGGYRRLLGQYAGGGAVLRGCGQGAD